MSDVSRARRTLYIGGLAETVDSKLLQAAFVPFGEIVDSQIPFNNVENKNKGFGFIEFAEENDAADAMSNMDGSELLGRTLRVTLARPLTKKTQAVWQEAETWWKTLSETEETEGAAAAAGGQQEEPKKA